MDHYKYANKFRDKWGTEYELLSQYEGSGKHIKMLHTKCGRIIEKSAGEAVRYGCVHCSRKANAKKGRTQSNLEEAFIKRLSDKFGNKYTLVGDYVDAKTSTRLRCECGREFNARPDDLLYGPRGCDCAYWKARAERKVKPPEPKPKREPIWTHEKFVMKVKEIWGDEFEVLTPYKTMTKPIKVKHSVCGEVIDKRPESLLNNRGCRFCSRNSMSAAVIMISSVLDSLGIDYKREVKMDGCRYKNPLFFDFAIYDHGELVSLIEYDGEQHFRASKYMGGSKKLALIKKRDAIKNEYCKANGIPLLRLNYKMIDCRGIEGREAIKTIIIERLGSSTA